MDGPAFFTALELDEGWPELVAVGGTLGPDTLAAAYRAGAFPWPGALGPATGRLARRAGAARLSGPDRQVPWMSPHPRAVLLPSMLRVSRSLRRTLRASGWRTTVDRAFPAVMAGCAARDETWISGRMREAYTALHEAGGAHSLEVWEGDRLVGGLYGVRTGGVFSGESMFHLVPDASKVALVDLVSRMLEGGLVLLDTQQETEHLASLGQVPVSRTDYLQALGVLRDRSTTLATEERPVARLVRRSAASVTADATA